MGNVTSVAVAVFITFWMFENIKSLLIMYFFYIDIYGTWNEYSLGCKSEKLIHS
jgi:hypothetical protein